MELEDHKISETGQKILKGLELSYKRLIQFKKKMNSELVVMQDDKIVRIKP